MESIAQNGIQVLITAHNAEKHLTECLDSIEYAVKGRPWVFVFTSDGSTDSTFDIASEFASKCSADHVYVRHYDKADNVAIAKNRTFSLINDFRRDYPFICVQDADDVMGRNRIDRLADVLIERKLKFVFGDYLLIDDKGIHAISSTKHCENLHMGIWCTLFHESLIPLSGKFFDEKMGMYEEFLKWWELKYRYGVEMKPIPGFITNYYYKRQSSMSSRSSKEQKDLLKEERNKLHPYCVSVDS